MNSNIEKVYMDYNATTPVDSSVITAIMQTYEEGWGNPSSFYAKGSKARTIIENARCRVAEMIGALPSDIIFTSGGTEGNNLVIHSAVVEYNLHTYQKASIPNGSHSGTLPHVITTNIEHDSIKLPVQNLTENKLIESTIVPVSTVTGCVDFRDIVSAVRPNTCLVTVMLANNETGIIQPVAEISQAVRKINKERKESQHNATPLWMHTDAAQAIGKIHVDVRELGIDFLTIVGHKFYGPRIGALYCNMDGSSNSKIHPMLFGGGQEQSLRPGTENTPLIAGLGKACELVNNHLEEYKSHMQDISNYLEEQLKTTFGNDVKFNGKRSGVECLPNTCSISFDNCDLTGTEILEKAGIIEASVGAACHKSLNISPILLASGIHKNLARTTIRLSIGRETTKEEVDMVVTVLKNAIYNC